MVENIAKDEEIEKPKEAEKKKKLTIMGLSIWRILAYFIIYSFVGYLSLIHISEPTRP